MNQSIKNDRTSSIVKLILFACVIALIFYLASGSLSSAKYVAESKFREDVVAGKVEQVSISSNTIKYRIAGSKIEAKNFPSQYDNYTTSLAITSTIEFLDDYNNGRLKSQNNTAPQVKIAYESKIQKTPWIISILPYIIIVAIMYLMFSTVTSSLKKDSNSALSFGKSRARIGNNSKVTFADVAGADEEKRELQEIVEFLKDPQKFVKLGARIPKGFLMVGPPGTGKTLLAKAVAGESNVPFFSITGSDFVEMFVGVGASRVRDLFNQAKAAAPCIVFIDEIDAVGRQRGAGLGGGNDEREQTLNQLLTQMDGFETNSGIVVMAATNRADVLDPALLRPGRFDRQIYVYPPDVKGRESILKVHARNKPLAKSIDLKQLARLTTGFTGADIELLLNEGAILAARQNKNVIEMSDLTEAINKVIMGPQKKSRVVTENDKKITAYHEAGHAIVAKRLLSSDEVQEVSIIPRGAAAGYTLHRPDTDDQFTTVSKLKAELAVSMGGRAAEMIKFKDFTSGAVSDIQNATRIATKMVTEWGMSSLGPINYSKGSEVFLGRDYSVKQTYSEVVAAQIDAEVKKLVEDALQTALKILKKDNKILENMKELLLEQETILSEEINLLMQGKTVKQVITAVNKKKKKVEKIEKVENQTIAERFKKQQEEKLEREKLLKAAEFLSQTGIMKVEIKEEPVQNNSENEPQEKQETKPAKKEEKPKTTKTNKQEETQNKGDKE